MPRFSMPLKGLNKAAEIEDQLPLTTQHIYNVRAPGTLERQLRLSQRPGMTTWHPNIMSGSGANPIVALTIVDVLD